MNSVHTVLFYVPFFFFVLLFHVDVLALVDISWKAYIRPNGWQKDWLESSFDVFSVWQCNSDQAHSKIQHRRPW